MQLEIFTIFKSFWLFCVAIILLSV